MFLLIKRNIESFDGCLRKSFICLHWRNNKYAKLRDKDDEYQKQTGDSNVGKGPNNLRACPIERFVEIGEPISAVANIKDNEGKSEHSQDVSQEKGIASLEQGDKVGFGQALESIQSSGEDQDQYNSR
jgi:hypothetical protein